MTDTQTAIAEMVPPLPPPGCIACIHVGGPIHGTNHVREAPAIGSAVQITWRDEATGINHLYARRYGGGPYLALVHQGPLPDALCPAAKLAMGSDQ
jgi:hypothetical protein